MAKNKLRKFAQMKDYPHVEEPEMELLKQGYPLKGNWKKEFFKNDNPLVLELGCGMGEYSVGLAEKYPEKNFFFQFPFNTYPCFKSSISGSST